MGRPFASRGEYYPLSGGRYPDQGVSDARAEGATVYLNINSYHLVNGVKTCYPFADVAAGTEDELLQTWVTELMAYDYPNTILTFHHEPTASSSSQPSCGTAAEYVAAFDHVFTYFRSHGISYPFAWTMVASSFGQGTASLWQPPAGNFQIVGVDGYNRDLSGQWRTPQYIFASAERYAAALGKSLLVGEIGSVEDPLDPSHKAAWITDAASLFRSFGNVVAVEWNDKDPYRPDTSSAALAAWVAASQLSFYA